MPGWVHHNHPRIGMRGLQSLCSPAIPMPGCAPMQQTPHWDAGTTAICVARASPCPGVTQCNKPRIGMRVYTPYVARASPCPGVRQCNKPRIGMQGLHPLCSPSIPMPGCAPLQPSPHWDAGLHPLCSPSIPMPGWVHRNHPRIGMRGLQLFV
jgi:hypothetical protein